MDVPLEAILTALRAHQKPVFDINEFCFKEQRSFIQDTHRFKTAVCSRRSGKTIACAADLIRTAISLPNRVCLYITLSRNNAKKIIWSELTKINKEYELNGSTNESDLSIKFSNGSVIYLSGANDKTEIDKFRGLPISLCYLDESQSFRPYIEQLVDDVISKALFDYNGTLCLIGTPGPIPSGYFYDCVQSKEWSHHSWTMFDNPYLRIKSGKDPKELLEEELKRKGVTIQDPTIQRECFAHWTTDVDALVFKYDPFKNNYESIPNVAGKWEYIIGVDLGYDDSDAIAVIGWPEHSKHAYLFEEHVRSKQGITELVEQIKRLMDKYDPMKVVMDTGGLGKKIAEEIRRRYSIAIHAAEKTRKIEYIELLNDAMRTQRFYAKSTSQFATDCRLVEWDRESEQPKISSAFHSDITDAVLYAYREALHWLSEPAEINIPRGTNAFYEKQALDIERDLVAQYQSSKENSFEDMTWDDLE